MTPHDTVPAPTPGAAPAQEEQDVPTAGADRAYARQVGARLRAVRTSQGRSLAQVEIRSGGRWKTALVGSYERGDRMISMTRLAALAAFYDVEVHDLLPGTQPAPLPPRVRLVLDLPALTQVSAADAGPLRRWVAVIQRQRGDYAGQVLSIRDGDLRTLATLYDRNPDDLIGLLRAWKVLDARSDLPDTFDPH